MIVSIEFRWREGVLGPNIVIVPQVKVSDDLHLLEKNVENVRLEETVVDSFDRLKLEFLLGVVQNRIRMGYAFALFAHLLFDKFTLWVVNNRTNARCPELSLTSSGEAQCDFWLS